MKICFLGLEMVPLNGKDLFIGGTVNNAIRLSKGLTKRGHKVHIVTSDINRIFKEDIRTPWGIIHPVPVHGPYGSITYAVEVITKLWYKIFMLNSQEKFDIINIHTGYSALSIFAFLISISTQIPVVLTLYSIAEGTGSLGGLYKRISAPMERSFFLSRVEKIVAISERVKKFLRDKRFASENIICIPPAVDLDQFNPYISKRRAREELGMNNNSSFILYIGSWNPSKGVKTLLNGVKNVLTDFSDVYLIIAWGGVEQDDLEKIKVQDMIRQLGFEARVTEFGAMHEVAKLMAASDIVVVPFLNTNGIADRPLTIIEAMACGRPVIASNVGGIDEIIKNGVNGIVVNPGQPSEIEQGLRFLLENKKESEIIGANATRYISQSHGIDQVVTTLEKLYEELQ